MSNSTPSADTKAAEGQKSRRLAGHYTNTLGMSGILSREKIWATNIKFLNDEEEFQHALQLISELLAEARSPGPPEAKKFSEFLAAIQSRLTSLDTIWAQGVFTVSFSKETDLLSQWRGYCPDSNGYCLTYDIDSVFEVIRSEYSEAHLVECKYEIEDKREILRGTLNKYWTEYNPLTDSKTMKQLLERFERDVRLLASYFKHPAFAEEREHRIVILFEDTDKVLFRPAKHCLVPYIELPIPRKHLDTIVIGPSPQRKLAERSMEAFLERCFSMPAFLASVRTRTSEIPYRAI
jgi:hypothetical protein